MNPNLFPVLWLAMFHAARYWWTVHTEKLGGAFLILLAGFFWKYDIGLFSDIFPPLLSSICTVALASYMVWLIIALYWMTLTEEERGRWVKRSGG